MLLFLFFLLFFLPLLLFFLYIPALVADIFSSSSCSSSLASDTPQLISVMKSHTSPALHIYNGVGMSTGLDLPTCDCNSHLSSRLSSSSSSSSSKCRLSGPSTSGSKHYHYKKHHRRASSGDKWKIQVSQELKAEIAKFSSKGWLYLFIWKQNQNDTTLVSCTLKLLLLSFYFVYQFTYVYFI